MQFLHLLIFGLAWKDDCHCRHRLGTGHSGYFNKRILWKSACEVSEIKPVLCTYLLAWRSLYFIICIWMMSVIMYEVCYNMYMYLLYAYTCRIMNCQWHMPVMYAIKVTSVVRVDFSCPVHSLQNDWSCLVLSAVFLEADSVSQD